MKNSILFVFNQRVNLKDGRKVRQIFLSGYDRVFRRVLLFVFRQMSFKKTKKKEEKKKFQPLQRRSFDGCRRT